MSAGALLRARAVEQVEPEPAVRVFGIDVDHLVRSRAPAIVRNVYVSSHLWFLLLRSMPAYLTVERKFGPREIALANSVPFVVATLLIVPAGMAGDILVRRGWNEVTVSKGVHHRWDAYGMPDCSSGVCSG